MDDTTALVLALQLVALCCVAVGLLLYLVCRIRGRSAQDDGVQVPPALAIGGGRAVLVTAADNAIGLQCCLRLSRLGYRVFAGVRCEGTHAEAVLRAAAKEREAAGGALVVIPLDVGREDLLHEAVDIVRAHLPAGEDGLWAVLNTAGMCYRGRLELQDGSHWDTLLKHNVVGALRTARTFLPLLKNKKGRLLNIGINTEYPVSSGMVAFTAARYAVEGATVALRRELMQYGIRVISLQIETGKSEQLFTSPKLVPQKANPEDSTILDVGTPSKFYNEEDFQVLPQKAMRMIENSLSSLKPKDSYQLLANSNIEKIKFAFQSQIKCFQKNSVK